MKDRQSIVGESAWDKNMGSHPLKQKEKEEQMVQKR